jgi:hypothetical protein
MPRGQAKNVQRMEGSATVAHHESGQIQERPIVEYGDANTPKLCPLQLVELEDGLNLWAREDDYRASDENLSLTRKTMLHSESSFTDVNQMVEKSVIDLFGVIKSDNQVISDIHFLGALKNFNVPLIKNSWKHSKIDYLELPVPQKY